MLALSPIYIYMDKYSVLWIKVIIDEDLHSMPLN